MQTTINKLRELGFTVRHNYAHNVWHTYLFYKGVLIIEVTEHKPTGKLYTLEAKLSEMYLPVTIPEIKQLDQIINKSYGSK